MPYRGITARSLLNSLLFTDFVLHDVPATTHPTSTSNCNCRWYHKDCVLRLPLVKANANGRFRCPLHYCKACGASGDSVPMMQCTRCPAGYHVRCRPEDSRIIAKKYLVCPDHAGQPPGQVGAVNGGGGGVAMMMSGGGGGGGGMGLGMGIGGGAVAMDGGQVVQSGMAQAQSAQAQAAQVAAQQAAFAAQQAQALAAVAAVASMPGMQLQ